MDLSQTIAQILSRYASPLRPSGSLEPLGNAGGLSGARLWRYRSEIGPLGLRAWPDDGPGRQHLDQVHHWLIEAAGTFWELAPWMPGTADQSPIPKEAPTRSAFEALASFHRKLEHERTMAASPGLIRRLELLQNLEQGGLSALRDAIENAKEEAPDRRELEMQWLSQAYAALPRLIEPASLAAQRPLPLQPCLRDARKEHFLFIDDKVTGLVDFGLMGLDCVAADLARLMGDWLPIVGSLRTEALAAYDAVRPLAADERAVLDSFESSADLLIGERWLRWHYLENKVFNDTTAVTEGIRRSVVRLERRSGGAW
jgi:homoserine kinase type II